MTDLDAMEPLIVSGIRRDMERTPSGRGGEVRFMPATEGYGMSGCPGDNLVNDWDAIAARVRELEATVQRVRDVVTRELIRDYGYVDDARVAESNAGYRVLRALDGGGAGK